MVSLGEKKGRRGYWEGVLPYLYRSWTGNRENSRRPVPSRRPPGLIWKISTSRYARRYRVLTRSFLPLRRDLRPTRVSSLRWRKASNSTSLPIRKERLGSDRK